MDKVVIIVGPTCSGKSRLAVDIAKEFNGEIINGDAFQVYRDLEIGINKTSEEMRHQVPHHLWDIVSPIDYFDVYKFQKLCRDKIDNISSRGKIAILCGGSGLIIDAAVKDYRFDESARIEQIEECSSNHEDLERINPELAKKIHPNNKRRIVRAIQIESNPSISQEERLKYGSSYLYDVVYIFLNPERDSLNELIDDKVDEMISSGWQDEIINLVNKYPDFLEANAAKALGYRELYAQGNEAIPSIKQKIKKYSKRQVTWFSNKNKDKTFSITFKKFDGEVKERAKLIVRRFINNEIEKK